MGGPCRWWNPSRWANAWAQPAQRRVPPRQQVQQTQGLEDLLATLFLLQLVVEVLPQLQGKKHITRSTVYGAYVDDYLAKEKALLMEFEDSGRRNESAHR